MKINKIKIIGILFLIFIVIFILIPYIINLSIWDMKKITIRRDYNMDFYSSIEIEDKTIAKFKKVERIEKASLAEVYYLYEFKALKPGRTKISFVKKDITKGEISNEVQEDYIVTISNDYNIECNRVEDYKNMVYDNE